MADDFVTVTGLEDLEKVLRSIPEIARELAQEASNDMAEDVGDEVRNSAPVDTGKLKASIDVAPVETDDPNVREAGVYIDNRAFYWRYTEYGTQAKAARPFITPAVERARGKMPGIFREKFGAVFEERVGAKK